MKGRSLGPYKIIEPLGAGGMGEVWLAEDTRLDRKVALKVLPAEFARDAGRLARFEQEAKAAAALNHPHIAAVFDVGSEAGDDPDVPTHFMVQEYLKGETLREPLGRGALPLKRALDLGTEIAEGLAAAHSAGIVHRDLKPENILITSEGHAKILDFGLAKLTEAAAPSSGSASMSPTMTVAGQVMGTAGYMAPEQVNGQDVDHRADLFAFGCVLYEMVTGKRSFAGKNVHDTFSRILSQDPLPVSESDGSLPLKLQWILDKSLAKEPAGRSQSAGDLAVDLRRLRAEVEAGTVHTGSEAPVRLPEEETGRSIRVKFTASLILVGVVAAGLGWWFARPEPLETSPRRFSIAIPEGTFLPTGVGNDLAISPDGQTLVYVGENVDGRQLYLRRMNDFDATPIPDTDEAQSPFFSPDGQWVAFSQGAAINKVSLAGFEIYPLCDPCGWGSWGYDGSVIFSEDDSLWRVPEMGGEPELVAGPMPEQGVSALIRPVVLPGNRAVLFENRRLAFGGVAVLSLETGEVVWVSRDGSDPFYSHSGHVVFPRGNTLFAVPFDLDSLSVTGRETHVLRGVRVENGGASQVALSDDGLLVYAPAGAAMGTQLTWVDRQGNTEPVSEQWRIFTGPRLSPDGEQIAVAVNEAGRLDIWIVEVGSGGMRPITTTGDAWGPVWSADGTRLTFASGGSGAFDIQWMPTDGNGKAETLLSSQYPIWPESWHPDGSMLVFGESAASDDILVFDLSTGSRTPLLDTDSNELAAVLSHDGTRLAYVSDKGGRLEVYVRPFPGPGSETPVSIGGGAAPMWSSDDSELMYEGRTMSRLDAATIDGLRVAGREVLLDVTAFWSGGPDRAHADVHPDGERLLVLKKSEDDGAPRINVVLDWFEELK